MNKGTSIYKTKTEAVNTGPSIYKIKTSQVNKGPSVWKINCSMLMAENEGENMINMKVQHYTVL
jgi:hypothetical protein